LPGPQWPIVLSVTNDMTLHPIRLSRPLAHPAELQPTARRPHVSTPADHSNDVRKGIGGFDVPAERRTEPPEPERKHP
jgi:hypothetical protein